MRTDEKEWIEAYSPETESTVLACMLNTEEQFRKAKTSLSPDDFFKDENRKIFQAILKTHEKNGAVDLPLLITHWKEFQDMSGSEYSYLMDLNNMGERYQNVEHYCQTLIEFSIKRSIITVYQDSINDLKKGITPSTSLERLIDKANAIKEHQRNNNSIFNHLLVKTSENEIIQEMGNISDGANVGMRIGSVDIKIPGGAVSIVAGPTGHGKTLVLINMILNFLEMHPEKSAFFFSFEESRSAILSLFLNTYINEELSQNNRSSIKSYFKTRSVDYISKEKRDIFINKKDEFFKSLIESGRLNIFYSDYSCEELNGAIAFLKKNTDVGIVGIDYMQFLRLQSRKTTQRQEELKQICLMLKDCAINTGLPILLAAQFNRSVVNEATISPVAIGEAGDIERAANTIFGLWNRSYAGFTEDGNKGKDKKPIPQESAIYLEILKSRETGIGHSSVFDLNGNTGKLNPRNSPKTKQNLPSFQTITNKRIHDAGKELWD